MTACAVELGLNVPGHPQSGVPLKPDYEPAGLDMNDAECRALVRYLADLPAPVETKSSTEAEAAYLAGGKKLFTEVGCAACHAPKLGEVAGIYSDLLLHDMGPDSEDTGDYGVFLPFSPGSKVEEPVEVHVTQAAPGGGEPPANNPGFVVGASSAEWRTPPLWGCRDSAPYMHDGRAQTLEQAIAFHGGQAARSAREFFLLTTEQRQQVTAFLKSLTAPSAQQLAHANK
jgi:CxxC motif-containing protein (DUF1111 family)